MARRRKFCPRPTGEDADVKPIEQVLRDMAFPGRGPSPPCYAEAQAAIVGLSGKQVGGRSLTVNEARPREDGGGGGGRGGFGGGGGRRGGFSCGQRY
jgi:hypothetical protein